MATVRGVVDWCLAVRHKVNHAAAEADQDLFQEIAACFGPDPDDQDFQSWPSYTQLLKLTTAYSRTVSAIYDRKHPYQTPAKQEPDTGTLVGMCFRCPGDDPRIPDGCSNWGWVIGREHRNYLVRFAAFAHGYRSDGDQGVLKAVPFGAMRDWVFRYQFQKEEETPTERRRQLLQDTGWRANRDIFAMTLEVLFEMRVEMRVPVCGVEGFSGYVSLRTPRDAARYIANPEQFAAGCFGCDTLDEYREWIKTEGIPRCGGVTKLGQPCGQFVGYHRLAFAEWRSRHRVERCRLHQNRRQPRRVALEEDPDTRIVRFPNRARE